MRIYEKREVIQVKTELVNCTCDFCGAGGNPGCLSVDWGEDEYDVDKTEISWTSGTNYPGDLNVETKYVDMCPACFRNKLLPWMLRQGVQPQIKKGSLR